MFHVDYLGFFDLRDYPFRFTSHIKYFYPSYIHQNVLRILTHALERGDGFW